MDKNYIKLKNILEELQESRKILKSINISLLTIKFCVVLATTIFVLFFIFNMFFMWCMVKGDKQMKKEMCFGYSLTVAVLWILCGVLIFIVYKYSKDNYAKPVIVDNPATKDENIKPRVVNNVKVILIPDGVVITPDGLESNNDVFKLEKDDCKYFVTLSRNDNKTINFVVYKYEVKDYEGLEDIVYTDLLLPVKNFQGLYKNDDISLTIQQYDTIAVSGEAGELGDISGQYELVKPKEGNWNNE